MVRVITNRVQVFSKQNPNSRPDVIKRKIHRKTPQVCVEGAGGRASPCSANESPEHPPSSS